MQNNPPPPALDLKTAFVDVFIQQYQLDKYPEDFGPSIINLYYDHADDCANIPFEHLLYLQNCKEPSISRTAQKYLDLASAAQLRSQPITANSRILLQGRSPRSAEDIKNQLDQLSIKTENALGKKTSHIFVGGFLTAKQIQNICRASLPIIAPRQLEQYFQQQGLRFLQPQQTSDDELKKQIQSLGALFASFDPANAYIALQILKTSGVPQDLITDLFIVAKSKNFPAGSRLFAKKLLQLHAPAAVQELLETANLLDHHAASPITAKYLFEKSPLDRHKIIRFLKTFPVAKNYTETAYIELLPLEEQYAELRRLAQIPNYLLVLNGLSLGLTNWILEGNLFRRISLNAYPALTRNPNIQFFAATEVEYLSCNIINVKKEWLDKFTAFKKLNTLELKNCAIMDFPDVFYAMPQLREIHLQGNYIPPQSINSDIYDIETYARTKILYRY